MKTKKINNITLGIKHIKTLFYLIKQRIRGLERMNLEIEEINERFGYVSVIDKDTNKEYYTQGEEGNQDIEYIARSSLHFSSSVTRS